MKKKVIITALITIVFLVSLLIDLSGFIWIALLTLLVVLSLLLIIWKSVRRKSIKSTLRLFGICFLILMFGILMGLFVPYKQALPNKKLSVSEQIQYIYNSDQSDRKSLKTYIISHNRELVAERDETRLKKIKGIYTDYIDEKIELSEQDKFNLSMIFHHGKTIEDYEIAHKLATELVESNSKIQNVEWLAKATYDRLLLSQGKPQKYGTQH